MSATTDKLRHEEIDISNKRLKIVRQDRIEAIEDEAFIEVAGQKYSVINYSSFGVALNIPKGCVFKKEFEGLFIYENVEVGPVHLKIIRVEPLKGENNKLALEVVGAPLNIETIYAIKFAHELIKSETAAARQQETIPREFRNIVFEMKDFLENIRTNLEHTDDSISRHGNRHAVEYQDTIAQIVGKYLDETFPQKYSQASAVLKDHDKEIVKQSIEFFRNKMQELLYRAPIVDRIFNKPLGYAGDFEMMNIIYKGDVAGRTLFEKCIHNFFIRNPAAQAVRNRSKYLCKRLAAVINSSHQEEIKVLSLACGPAREIQMLLDEKRIKRDARLTIHLLDQDENALKHAQLELKKRLVDFPNIKVEYIHTAIKNIVGRGFSHSGYNLIYTAGLFDYFSDPVAQVAATKAVDALKPNGELLIGNFDVNNPAKPIMEIALDWYLIYRSEDDLKRLFGRLGRKFDVEKEELGINLFCVVTR